MFSSDIEKKGTYQTERRFDPPIKKKIEFIKKEDSHSNRSKSGNGKKSVKRTVHLTVMAAGKEKIFKNRNLREGDFKWN